MMLNTTHHVAIIVSDYEKAREFYVDKLELPIIRENYREERGDYKLDLQVGDIELEIFGVKNPPKRVTNPEACGLRHFAFKVDDIDEAVNALYYNRFETFLNNIEIKIYNISGKLLYIKKIPQIISGDEIIIETGNYNKGIYIINIVGDRISETLKVCLN